MRFGNITKSKDKFTYIALVISLLFGVSCSMLPSYFVDLENIDPSQISNIGQTISRFTNYVMPFLRPAITALSTTSPLIAILNTLLFIIISLAAVGLFLLISSKVYLKGVMNGSESKSKKKKNDSLKLAKETKRSSVFKTYALKEWRIMFRTPIYNMNLIVVDLIMIVIFGFSFIGGNASGEEGKLMLNEILKFRLPSNNGGFIFFILAGTLFFNGVSAIAATAISREGKTAWFMKFIPVSPILQINAKIFFGVIVHLFVPTLLLIVSLVIGMITIVDFIFILIPFILVTIYLNYWCILIDLARPKLNWDNETVAVKQNMNSLFCLFIAFLLALLMAGIGFILTYANTIRENIGWTNLTFISIIAGVVLILVSLFMLLKLMKKFKSLINWTLIINLFSLTLLVGGIVLFVGLFELLNHYYHINFGLATWSIIISLCTFSSLILIYKGIVNKGDSMFQNID
jgi:ABC-2 type transport system permease protein